MPNECAKIQDKINDYADGLLDDAQKAAVEAHINACPECMNEYRALQKLLGTLGALQDAPVPDDFADNLRMRLAQSKRPSAYVYRHLRSFSALAAGLLLVLLVRAGYYADFGKYKTAYVNDIELKTVDGTPSPQPPDGYKEQAATEAPSPEPAATARAAIRKQHAEDRTDIQMRRIADTVPVVEDTPAPEAAQEYKAFSVLGDTPPAPDNADTGNVKMDSNDNAAPTQESGEPLLPDAAVKRAAGTGATMPSPSAEPLQKYSVSTHDVDEPSFVSVSVQVDDYQAVLTALKAYNAVDNDGCIVLELDGEDFQNVMTLLVNYGARVVQDETATGLTANKIVITSK